MSARSRLGGLFAIDFGCTGCEAGANTRIGMCRWQGMTVPLDGKKAKLAAERPNWEISEIANESSPGGHHRRLLDTAAATAKLTKPEDLRTPLITLRTWRFPRWDRRERLDTRRDGVRPHRGGRLVGSRDLLRLSPPSSSGRRHPSTPPPGPPRLGRPDSL